MIRWWEGEMSHVYPVDIYWHIILFWRRMKTEVLVRRSLKSTKNMLLLWCDSLILHAYFLFCCWSVRPNSNCVLIHYELFILQKSSVNRINYLKSLVEFMSEATKELIWMNQREEPEVSRDWSITDHDIEDLQAHGEVLWLWEERDWGRVGNDAVA